MKLKKFFSLRNVGTVYSMFLGITSMLVISSCKKDGIVAESTPTTASIAVATNEASILENDENEPDQIISISSIATMSTTAMSNEVSYRTSAPLVYTGKSDFTISGVSITAGSQPAITLNNCTNVTIRLSRFVNGNNVKAVGVYLHKCKNVKIEYCYFANVASGVYAEGSTKVKVLNNEMKNMLGPMPRGQFVQFNACYGPNNKIIGNKFENVMGQSNPEDAINIYRSSGTTKSPITISYNWIRGGGPSYTGGGIALGDDGGSYQSALNNVLVNPGQYGIAIASGKTMTIKNNKIFAAQAPYTNVGTFAWNQYSSTTGCSLVTITGNEVNFTAAGGYQNPSWNGGNCGTITGWNNNKWGSSDITATILPSNMISMR